MGKRSFVAIKGNKARGHIDLDPGSGVKNRGHGKAGQRVIVRPKKRNPLGGRENPGVFEAVGSLPRAHRAPRAGPERAIDRRIVKPFPTQSDL